MEQNLQNIQTLVKDMEQGIQDINKFVTIIINEYKQIKIEQKAMEMIIDDLSRRIINIENQTDNNVDRIHS